MGISCFVSSGRSLDTAVQRVRLAESLGYEAAYVMNIAGRDALTVLTVYAGATETIRLGTGVVAARGGSGRRSATFLLA